MNDDQSVLEQRRQQTDRNSANNANTIRNAANVAEASGHPVASAIGKGVKAADKLTDGKLTNSLGKSMSRLNNMSGLQGKMLQGASNKLSESGTGDRIAKAANKRNSPSNRGIGTAGNADLSDKSASKNANKNIKSPKAGIGNLKNNGENLDDSSLKETEEQASDGGHQSFQVSFKVVKWVLILSAPIMMIVVFCCLLITASNVYLEAIGLGNADKIRENDEVEKKVNKKTEDDELEGVEDEDVAFDVFISNERSLSFAKNKFAESNIEKVSNTTYLKGKYNEADLDRIEDFYPAITDLSKNYDKNMVYDFYFKMYNLYIIYRDKYNVILDLPLLMSTLNIQSQDMYVVFSSNLSPEDRDTKPRKNYDDMDYYHDWSGYITTKDISNHDMEVLAQHMVSEVSSDQCDSPVNGKCYVIDNDKYREFLKEFIEKKYYLDGEIPISGNNNSSSDDNNSGAANNNNNSNSDNSNDNINNSNNNNNVNIKNGDWRTWTQCGQSWSSMIVPKSNSDMCNIGCLITSITIQIARSGTSTIESPIDPGIALNYYSFVNGGNFVWGSTTNLAPNFRYFSSISLAGMNRKNIAEKLSSYDSSKYYIVLAVSRIDESAISHYVAFDYADLSTSNLYMMDPVSTDNKDLYSIYKLYSAYIYEKKD